MTEIEKMKAEIDTLNRAAEIASKLDGCGFEMVKFHRAKKMTMEKLAKLEAEAAEKVDPWAMEKESVAKLCEPEIRPFLALTPEDTRRIRASHAARYVKHLQNRVAELEAELAKRPKVYCVKTHYGIATTGSRSKVPRVFLAESIEDEYGDGEQCVVPYTGQKS